MIRLNPDRFKFTPAFKLSDEIENHIEKSIKKFFRSSVHKTRIQALLEEMEGYFARNSQYHKDIPDFRTYSQHWIVAHRGVIDNNYLDELEKVFGQLEGSLHIHPGTSSWDTRKDLR